MNLIDLYEYLEEKDVDEEIEQSDIEYKALKKRRTLRFEYLKTYFSLNYYHKIGSCILVVNFVDDRYSDIDGRWEGPANFEISLNTSQNAKLIIDIPEDEIEDDFRELDYLKIMVLEMGLPNKADGSKPQVAKV